MSLTYGLSTICDLFAKLQRDAAALDKEVTSDRMFNFVLTGYSMIDWIKNEPSVPASAKDKFAVDGLYTDQWLKICGDLATAGKHFKLTSRVPITAAATSANSFGMGRYGKGGYGIGEESIVVQLNDGTTFHCLDLVNGVQSTWNRYFSDHRICKVSVDV
jgi:hypothetical protein